MSKYDFLDARKELEQTISADLKRALEKRGFSVKHNGTKDSSAPGNKADIELYNSTYHITVEVTKTTKSNADREFLAIKDHLEQIKNTYTSKKCFTIYVSPETHYRMMNAIRDHDILNSKKNDLKILPFSFASFELFITKLIQSHKEQYNKTLIIGLFNEYLNFLDDERVLRILYDKLFSDDEQLKREIQIKEENRHQQTVENLVKDLLNLENKLREELGITHTDAIRDIIFLVFIKLYEEKREFEGKENRFKRHTFPKFQEYINDEKLAGHELFKLIKEDKELKSAKVFTDSDFLSDKLDDNFILKFYIEPFEKYHFYTTKVDGLGAAYEVLGMRAGKDVKAGQFFTPENVVRFMVHMAELDYDDVVLDPACGTARFLIYSMYDMIEKVRGRNQDDKVKNIKVKQLYGSDYDPNVAKLAKMNMYIHGDGKTNIMDQDGLLLFHFDNQIDAILTNPPLGDQSYQKTSYDDIFKKERMAVIPKNNVSTDNLKSLRDKLNALKESLLKAKETQSQKNVQRISKNIEECERKIVNLEEDIARGTVEHKVSGTQMKGGALFINAAYHYLKTVRNEDALPEWRGGKLLLILDEGILNTEDYSNVRNFVKEHFYIKAVISLTRDTFIPISHTSTKTSILYCIKKEDLDAVQQEPIFFAHVDKVGLNTKGKVCENHLFSGNKKNILKNYMEFKKNVLDSYDGLAFNRKRFVGKKKNV